MNTYGTVTLRLSRPLHERLASALAHAWHDLHAALRLHRARRHHARSLAALSRMSEATLRDIGAPDCLIAEAAARRDVDRQRLVEMSMGMPRHG